MVIGRGKPLCLAVLNAHSAANKAPEIHNTLQSNNIDVLLLTETWIVCNAPLAVKLDIALACYCVKHVHWAALSTRGRKAEQVKSGSSLAVVYRDTLELSDWSSLLGLHNTFELILVKTTARKQSIHLAGVYQTPPAADSAFFTELLSLLDAVETLPGNPMICGDFNSTGKPASDSLNPTVDVHLLQQSITGISFNRSKRRGKKWTETFLILS